MRKARICRILVFLLFFTALATAQTALNAPALPVLNDTARVAQAPEARVEPEKFAVFVSGASEDGINKSLSHKLTAAIMVNSGYLEIDEPQAFYSEIAAIPAVGNSQIIQIAGKHKANFVYIVGILEAFGSHSISAKIIKTADSSVVKAFSFDRSLKSFDDLTNVSKQLAAEFILQSNPQHQGTNLPASAPAAQAAAPAAPSKRCDKRFNINEILFQIRDGFPTQLKDCGTSFAKETVLAKSPFAKKAAPEPKSFMTQCTIDGIKTKLPADFPGVDKVLGDVQGFINNILNTAMAGASLDPSKLMSAIGDMKIDDLLNSVKKLSAENECIIDKPYVPPVQTIKPHGDYLEDEDGSEKDGGAFSLGFRFGINGSWLSGTYNNGSRSGSGSYESTMGLQAGLAFDFAAGETLHIQPGIMYVGKGAQDKNVYVTLRYIEIPLLFSLKFSSFRINAGPYFDLCIATDTGGGGNYYSYYNINHSDFDNNDIGLSMGFGFDIGSFYIGLLYDYGFTNVYDGRYFEYYNRTLGLNFGVNL